MRLGNTSTKFISLLINQVRDNSEKLRRVQLVILRLQPFSSGDQRARARKFSPTSCFYKTLNVSADASFEEIRKSYLTLAKQLHPDVDSGNPAQEEKFKELHEAYSVLSNEKSRELYDSETGLNSSWKYDSKSGDFTENNERINEFAKATAENVKKKIKEDEQMFDYFDKKYFKNKEFFNKPVTDDSPFEVTRKLQRQKIEGIKRKRDDYVMYYPFTWKAYYEKRPGLKTEEDDEDDDVLRKKLQKQKFVTYLSLLHDFRYPILFGFFALTLYAAYKSIFDDRRTSNNNLKKRDFVREGAGYTTKMTPINVV